jgi:hypothetical protein
MAERPIQPAGEDADATAKGRIWSDWVGLFLDLRVGGGSQTRGGTSADAEASPFAEASEGRMADRPPEPVGEEVCAAQSQSPIANSQ